MKRWHLLTVLQGAEDKAVELLAEVGLAAYTPHSVVWRKLRRHQRKLGYPIRKRIVVALFPGYIFVNVDFAIRNPSSARPIRKRNLLGWYVRAGADYLYVADSVIAAMQAAEALGRWDETAKLAREAQAMIGKQYCVTGGPLTGLTCTVKAIKNQHAECEIEVMHAKVRVPIAQLEKP